ncbi:hypothetical protein ACFV0L_39765 [Streptosporangium canum]|uniref:hypothetical protein n=1 Tax=Streptosporangium canum TaxID=324952 RepID=UPI003692FFD8
MDAALILGGKLGDRFGRRTYYVIGAVGSTIASVAILAAVGVRRNPEATRH